MHLIDVRNVYKIYNPGENQVNALDGVSLTIDEGEFVAIIGQSGSGKSTLMNMLGLLDTPTEGEYYINGKLVDDLTDDQMSDIRNKQIGFIFQGFNLIASLDALENVELPLVYRGVPRAEREQLSKAALEKVGLGSRMHHLPAALSGGQQQRVAIARAIAAAPPVILADEPTGNLDTRSTKDVMQILHNLKDEGRTVIVITHDNEIAEQAERVIRIRDGKVVEDYINPGFEEKFYFTPGDLGYKAFETKFGRIGVLICWDQWYPEAARLTAMQGAEIIFYPTAIGWLPEEKPLLGEQQHCAWETVQRGHAVANGCYVCAVNRVGTEGESEFWGQSFVADYYGQIVAKAPVSDEAILYAELDLDALEDHRRIWPFFRDRRIDSYGGITERWGK